MGDWSDYCGTLKGFIDLEEIEDGEYRDEFMLLGDYAAYADEWD